MPFKLRVSGDNTSILVLIRYFIIIEYMNIESKSWHVSSQEELRDLIKHLKGVVESNPRMKTELLMVRHPVNSQNTGFSLAELHPELYDGQVSLLASRTFNVMFVKNPA